jgi:hypothetical protein
MPYGTVNADLMTTSDGVSSSGLYGFKNRIINGAMAIDQRNAGASVTLTANQYTLDRWGFLLSQSSKLTTQQSTTVPTGFKNSLLATSSSAYSVLSSDYFIFRQPIEGLNVADLGWGAAGASTVTLSFWVRSSLTGTFGGSLRNSVGDRSYPFTYTISSANTFEYKTITIAGDTSGTWLTTNGLGIDLGFGLGVGSTYSATAGSWQAGNYVSATGATSVVGTNGATFYITGVQLEKGSVATSFDYRPYGAELALCQRYFENCTGAIRAASSGSFIGTTVAFKSTKRASPTLTFISSGTNSGAGFASFVAGVSGMDLEGCFPQWSSATGGFDYGFKITAASEL